MKRGVSRLIVLPVPCTILATWWLATENSTNFAFPPLRLILARLAEFVTSNHLTSDILPSLSRFFAGFFLAAILGIVLGFLLARSPLLMRLADPPLQFLRALPPPALLPILLLFFGIGAKVQIALITIGSLWSVLLNTIEGLRGVNAVVRDTSASFQIRKVDHIFLVLLPSAARSIFAGLRTALAVALALMIVSEMVAASNGLGYFTIIAQRTFNITDMWVGILLLGVSGFVLNLLFTVVERKILFWQSDEPRQ